MTGVQLAAEIFKIRADLPIILCSGFSEKIDSRNARDLGIRNYIAKPFNLHELAEAVRRALDGL